MKPKLLIVACFIAWPFVVTTQQPATIVGIVLDDLGKPVAGARVGLANSKWAFERSTICGDAGEFSLTDLQAGTFTLAVSKAGYAETGFGQAVASLPPASLTLTPGAKRTLTLRLPRGAVITGLITDQDGDPLSLATVRVLRRVILNDRLTYEGIAQARSNSLGEYRAFGLAAGTYFVSAAADLPGGADIRRGNADVNDAAVSFPTVYYGGGVELGQAVPVLVGTAQDVRGIDIRISPVPVASIEGMVENLPGPVGAGTRVERFPEGDIDPYSSSYETSAPVRPDGSFTLQAVPAGRHSLAVRVTERPSRSDPMGLSSLWASTTIVTNGSLARVTLTLAAGATVSGRFVLESGTSTVDTSKIAVALIPRSGPFLRQLGAGVSAQPSGSSTFLFRSVPPGLYSLRVANLPSSWSVLSELDAPLEVKSGAAAPELIVTLANRQTELSGTLTGQDGRPTFDHAIAIFSTDRAHWTPVSRRVRMLQPDSDGHFAIAGLPSGEYFVVAGAERAGNIEIDPSRLAELVPAATRINLRLGEKIVQNLQVK
jgi:carboxypeptidase family protein